MYIADTGEFEKFAGYCKGAKSHGLGKLSDF